MLIIRLLLVAFLLAPLNVFSQEGRDLFQKHVFQGQSKDSLLYRQLDPPKSESGKKHPLVIFFHGAGERGDDNQAQLVHGMKDFLKPEIRKNYPCYVIAPQCPKGAQWVEVPWSADKHQLPAKPSKPMKLALELLKQKISLPSVDSSRIYVTGLSMGGFGTFDAISRQPDWFAAALPICGGGDESQAKRIKNIPIWIVHGDADRVVKPSRSQNMFNAIKAEKGNVKLTMQKGVGHNSWTATYANPETFAWMFAQRKATGKK